MAAILDQFGREIRKAKHYGFVLQDAEPPQQTEEPAALADAIGFPLPDPPEMPDEVLG